ncbi:YitT family protein [Porphyromonadaceae bacterium W3.11]|nr:YitT family protein [Porphyromonadaceae bacterium W3.11]
MNKRVDFRAFIKPATSPKWWLSWGQLLLGSTIMAAAFVYFINPYKLSPGGVYGASVVLHNIFPSIQVGTFGYMFDIPLITISIILLGKTFGIRTIVSALTVPAIMNVMTYYSYGKDKEAIAALDPSQLLGGIMDLSDHMILATILGAVMAGIGSGIIIRAKATSGGTDLIAMLMQKYLRIPFSSAIFMADGCVVLFGLIVLGFGVGLKEPNPEPMMYLTFYSLLAIYITSRTVKFVLNGTKNDKVIQVITDERPTELHDYIINDIDRTATITKCSGLYSKKEKEVLMLVVQNREVLNITKKIKQVDPKAFVVVSDCYDAYGEGWKILPEHDEIAPE